MNDLKAIMLSIKPKWWKAIVSGEKQFEFRGKNTKNFKSGMKVYVYESLGDRKPIEKWEDYPEYLSWRYNNGEGMLLDYVTEGHGKVVGEFVIGKKFEEITLSKDYISIRKLENNRTLMGIGHYGKVYGDNDTDKPYYYLQLGLTKEEMKEQGYSNQAFAYEITNLIVYDDKGCDYDKCTYAGCHYFEFTNGCEDKCNKPTKPLDIVQFLLFDEKVHKQHEELRIKFEEGIYTSIRDRLHYKLLKRPPQSFCYVVDVILGKNE